MIGWVVRPFFALLTLIGLYAAVRSVHLLRSKHEPSPTVVGELQVLGTRALESGDVPVASVLLYGDSIIGRGYNTVLRDGDAGGHAEVNAVSDAMAHLGNEAFGSLDREQLLLISTFEPCAMCRGMLLEYRIDRVSFIEPKSLWHWLKEDARWLGYELTKTGSEPERFQDSLFRLHPAYPER